MTQPPCASARESPAVLPGGLAHDFNNILAIIVAYAEMAQNAAPAHSAQARYLECVVQAALRGQALVEQGLQTPAAPAQPP